ncbi:hypothetical protein ACFX13_038960 [Malus domestica]
MRLAEIAILLLLVLACIRSNNAASKSSFFLTPFGHDHHHNVAKWMKGSSVNGRVFRGAATNFREFCKSKGQTKIHKNLYTPAPE